MASRGQWIALIIVAIIGYEVIGGYLGYSTLSDVYGEFNKDGGTARIDLMYLKPQGTPVADGGTIYLNNSDLIIQTVGVNFYVDAPQTLMANKWSWVLIEGSSTFPPNPYTATPIANGEVDFFDMFNKHHSIDYQYYWNENVSGSTQLAGLTLILYNSNSVEVARDYYDVNVYLYP